MNVYDINGGALIKKDAVVSLSIFQSIGVIGDSFASGEIYTNGHDDYYLLSWGQIMGRMSGASVVNYSEGGLTTQTWLTDEDHGLAKLNAEQANNLYVIALGINDTNRLTPTRLGTIADVESDSVDSFYSYYGRVIRAVKTHAPGAVIMLSTLARFGGDYDLFSEAVRAIGEHYGLDVLDLADSEFFQSDFFADNQQSNHPTAVNYSGMAKEYQRLIEQALESNPSKYSGYVGQVIS